MVTKKVRYKDSKGKVYEYDIGAKAENVEENATRRFVSDTEKEKWNGKIGTDTQIEFTEATGRQNINTKETLGTILGKVKKFFTDLKPHSFYDLVQNATTAAVDRAVSAAVAKNLQDQINQQNTKIKILKTVFVADSCVTDANNSGMQPYPYRGTIWGNAIIQQVDSLISQGYTVLGGALVQGPLNDGETGQSCGMGYGIILQTGQYKNVPARFTVNSTGLQTMRVIVMILYY